ncbi:MAG: hypothetical protein WAM60_10640 [Candidatus Promineifilaceae bacterium]
MAQSLAEKLEAARRQQFVGRSTERELLRESLAAPDFPFVLFYIYGPGGVGKTSLLREASHIASQVEVATHWLDARDLDTSPTGFMASLRQSLGISDPAKVFETLSAMNGRILLLIDTAELLVPLDGWLRDIFLPQLPGNVLVIIAGRNPPSLRWRTDPGWQQLMRIVPLKNLNQEESRAYLMRRQLPARQHEAILQFTHGHPLALSLVADVFEQQPKTEFRPENAPNIIKTLLDQFMLETPTAHHRAAVEACSQVRLMSEPLLGAMLKLDDPYPIFDWLRDLSFMESDRRGLYPHDLAREALAADLRWRDPARQVDLHTLARAYYMQRFREGDSRVQRQILADYIFLHRDNPLIRAYFDWQSTGTVFTDSYREEDQEALLEIIRKHEGETAEKLAGHWLTRQPQGMVVVRYADGTPQGLLFNLALEKCAPEDRALDPAVTAVWRYLDTRAPLRPGETAIQFRFWMAAESYQKTSPVQSRIFLNIVQQYLTTPGLAFTFLPCAVPEFWKDIFEFADQRRLPQADFIVDGRSFGVYGHDWRAVPPLIWLANMAKQELGGYEETAVDEAVMPALPVFDEAGFAAAVRDGLRDYTNEVALQNNPLLQSRLLLSVTGVNADKTTQVSQLRTLLAEADQTMQEHPKQMKWHRALHHTYFQPAATQEQAAELLDLPFSTYRRHLRAAIQYVTEWLWAREIAS